MLTCSTPDGTIKSGMDSLDKLNSQQYQAVTVGNGQTLVLAGPGSGKTRVLTHRIAYLIQEMGVRPYEILAVTFTNKAARVMGSRVQDLMEDSTESLWLGTYHSICARIMRREVNYLPVDSNFVIMDSDDQQTLIKRVLKELNLSDKIYRPSSVQSEISNAKNNLYTPKDYPRGNYREEVIGRIYERYQDMLRSSNAVDFDDMLMMTVQLLVDHPEVCQRYAQKFVHVLVDEFQDTNMAQYELLKLFASYHQNLFVVGDEDQSIYRWRGADYRNVMRFEKEYPKCEKILLEQNYRSSQNILDAARAVIDKNSYRTPKALFTDSGSGEKISLFEAADDHAEADFVASTIQELTRRKAARNGDFAIMYRTNAQSRLFEEACMRSGIAYKLVGALRFYGRKEIKDVIAYLRLIYNPADSVSLQRIINFPTRGIGDKTVAQLLTTAQKYRLSAGDVLLDFGRKGADSPYLAGFSGRSAAALTDFGNMLAGWKNQSETIPLTTLFDHILEDIRLEEIVNDGSSEGESRWENVQELRRLAYEYQEAGLADFLEKLALVSDQDTIPEQEDSAVMLTLHAAKGLEFNQVFIVGLDEGTLPHSRSFDDPEEMAEERRLFYVGLTRARKHVYLVRAEQRNTYGSFSFCDASRFLEDIPDDLLEHQGQRFSSRAAATDWGKSPRWESPAPASRPPSRTASSTPPSAPRSASILQPKFSAMMHVSHDSWGEGVVLESRIQDKSEIVTVNFASVGLKRLDASIANLDIIE